MLIVHRTALRRRGLKVIGLSGWNISRNYHPCRRQQKKAQDPRFGDLGNVLEDDFASIRENYQTPKNPIILAHGLLGFDELQMAGGLLPGIQYWYGVTEALASKGIEVITATVPPSGRIEERAKRLAESIERKAGGKAVNIIA